MATTIASGLGATFGYAAETAYGTFVAPSKFLTFEKESIKEKKNIVQSKALHGGLYDLASRRAFTTHTVDGAVDFDLYDRGQGLLWEQALGSTPTVTENGTTGVYTQVHTPGDTVGKSLSFQVGRPQTNGTVVPFSWSGVKVTDWELAVATSQVGKLTFTIDAATESVAQTFAAPSFVTSNMLHFAEAVVLVGGTPATTSGVCSITGGTPIATVLSASVKGTNGLDVSRFFLGASGTKAEPLANNFRALTGMLDIQFENLTDAYNLFAADTNTSLQLNFTSTQQIAAGQNSSVQILIPRVYFDDADPTVDGPAVLHSQVNFTGLDDGVNPPIQVTLVSLDQTP